MKSNSLLIMTAAVLLLGGFIFFFEKDLPSTEERRELEKKIIDLEKEAVSHLILESPEGRVHLERNPQDEVAQGEEPGVEAVQPMESQTWYLREPFEARADSAAIDGLLNQLVALEKKRSFEDLPRSEAGLDEPRARITLQTAEEVVVLEIGAEVPASSQMLVALQDRASIHQVGKSLFEALSKPPGDWRDRQLFHANRDAIHNLTLRTDKQILRLEKDNKTFRLAEPIVDRADEEAVNRLLSSLTTLKAGRFVDDPLLDTEKAGLEPAWAVLEAGLGESTPFRLEIGDQTPGGQLFARLGSQIVEIGPELQSSFDLPVEAWRSKSWSALQVFRIDRLEVDSRGELLTITRDGTDWLRDGERIPYSAASDLLYALTEVQATRLLTRAQTKEFSFESPQRIFRLTDQDGFGEELQIFSNDGQILATTDDRTVVLELDPMVLPDLDSKFEALQSTETLTEEKEEDATTPTS